jgi:hypothetical protein
LRAGKDMHFDVLQKRKTLKQGGGSHAKARRRFSVILTCNQTAIKAGADTKRSGKAPPRPGPPPCQWGRRSPEGGCGGMFIGS